MPGRLVRSPADAYSPRRPGKLSPTGVCTMKSCLGAYFCWFFFGWIAAHRLYLGRPLSAMLFIMTCGGFGLWWLIDFFLIPEMVYEYNAGLYAWAGNSNKNVNIINVTVVNEGETRRRRKKEEDKNPFDFS
jgi:TM2 domain-containing membrane protein YozV